MYGSSALARRTIKEMFLAHFFFATSGQGSTQNETSLALSRPLAWDNLLTCLENAMKLVFTAISLTLLFVLVHISSPACFGADGKSPFEEYLQSMEEEDQRLRESDPIYTQYHEKRAKELSRAGKYKSAVKELELADECVEKSYGEPLYAEIHTKLSFEKAHQLSLLGEHARAIQEYISAINSDSDGLASESYKTDRDFNTAVLLMKAGEVLAWLAKISVVAGVIAFLIWIAKKSRAPLAVSAIMLITLAMLDNNFGDCFTVLKFGIFGLLGYKACMLYKAGQIRWVWAYGMLAWLFNPILRTQLEESSWVFACFISIAVLVASVFTLNRNSPEERDSLRRRNSKDVNNHEQDSGEVDSIADRLTKLAR